MWASTRNVRFRAGMLTFPANSRSRVSNRLSWVAHAHQHPHPHTDPFTLSALSHPGASTAPTRMGFLFLVKHLCLPSLALWHETCLNIRGACVWVTAREPRGPRGRGGELGGARGRRTAARCGTCAVSVVEHRNSPYFEASGRDMSMLHAARVWPCPQ